MTHARNLSNRSTDFVSVKDYGAVGDGVTDDTAAIQAALNVGGEVFFPPGTYKISDSLDVKSSTTVHVASGATIKSAASIAWLDTGMLEIRGRTNVQIVGAGIIDGNKANNAAGRTYGVLVYNSTYVCVDGGLYVTNMPGLNSAGTNGGDGIIVYGASSASIYIGSVTCDANVRQGISLVAGNGITVNGARLLNTTGTNPGAGIDIEADVPGTLLNVSIVGCLFDGNYRSLQINSASHVTVSGCIMRNAREAEIFAANADNVSIDSSNQLYPAPTIASPIVFLDHITDAYIAPLIHGSGGVNETAAVRVLDGCNRIRVAPQCRNVNGGGTLVNPSGVAVSDIWVEGGAYNDCGAGGAATIYVGSYSGISRVYVRNNSICDSGTGTNYGILFDSSLPSANRATCREENNVVSGTYDVAAIDNSPLYGLILWNPANLVDGAGETSSAITASGAALGDTVVVYPPYDLQGVTCTGWVSAANTVKIRLQNETGTAVDLANDNWRVRVGKFYG